MQLKKSKYVLFSLVALLISFVVAPGRTTYAFSQGDLVSGGSIWLETTIAVALVFVTAMAFSLQIARGYFIRVLNKFTLRLGADIWWLAYILIRDALIFMSFVMGLLVFFPGTFLDYSMAVPFMPLSVVFFGAALVTKLYVDADDNRNAFRLVTVLVFIGTLLWISGTIFVTESPLQLSTLPGGVSYTSGIWYSMYQTFSSENNLSLAMLSFQICFALLGVIGVLGFAHPILHSRLPFNKKSNKKNASTSSSSLGSPQSIGGSSSTPVARSFTQYNKSKNTVETGGSWSTPAFRANPRSYQAPIDTSSENAVKPDYIG